MSPVERALDELFETEPSEFTKKRDALVKELKKAGDKEGAAFVAARRKPTQIAYVLNQLARQHPDAVAELVDVGRELAREQRRALRGEASHGLRDSIDRQRKAIAEVGQKAAAVMKSLGVDPMANLQEVTMALQAALIDPTIGAQLEAGQLEKAPEAAVGFGAAPLPDTPSTRELEEAREKKTHERKSSPPPPKPHHDDEEEKAREKAKEKEKERARAAHAKELAEAKHVLSAAEKEAKKAHADAERARSESDDAEAALKKARAAADEASREARRLASEASAADRTVAAAEKEVARLEKSAP